MTRRTSRRRRAPWEGRAYASTMFACAFRLLQLAEWLQELSDASSDNSDALYCLCHRKSKPGEFMVQCETCEDWSSAAAIDASAHGPQVPSALRRQHPARAGAAGQLSLPDMCPGDHARCGAWR